VVVGTDTGIGKTVVTAGLVLALRRRGLHATPWKPWGSGAVRTAAGWRSPDAVWWKRTLGLRASLADLNPACYRRPLAPWVAARAEGPAARWPAIAAAGRRLGLGARPVLVEGVGGVLVPLERRLSCADLARRLRAPALVVARAGLGTLNHTLLTLEALARRRVRVVGVLLNGARGRDAAERTNPAALRALAGVPVWGPLAWRGGHRSRAGLSRWARGLPAGCVAAVARALA